MRYWHLFLFIYLIFLSKSSGLDSETNEKIYKFAEVNGEPTTLNNASEIIEKVENFKECTEKCLNDFKCIMVHQSNLTGQCHLFQWNSVQSIRSNDSGGEGITAFKVYTDQPSCDLNSQFLMNGRLYPLYPNDTDQYLWKIDTAEEGWTITYIGSRQEENLVCGNFSFDRPYSDGCNDECKNTMVQVYALPGPLTLPEDGTVPMGTWMDCLNFCHGNKSCFVVYYINGGCRYWNIDTIWFLNRTSAADGHHMAIKIPLSNTSCKLTTEELLNDKYYLPYHRLYDAFSREFFRIRTTPKYYKITSYLDETNKFVRSYNACQHWFIGTAGSKTQDYICHRMQPAEGITQIQAKELCNEMDGELAPERFEASVQQCRRSPNWQDYVFEWPNPLPKWGILDFNTRPSLKIWFGLEKDPKDQQWQWTRPDWQVTTDTVANEVCYYNGDSKTSKNVVANRPVMTWAPGEPKNEPGYDCAYMLYKFGSPYPGYGFVAAPCNSTPGDAFNCANEQTTKRGIPPFKKIADEYSVDPPYSQVVCNNCPNL